MRDAGSDSDDDLEPPLYGLDSSNATTFLQNLKSLAQSTYIWHSVDMPSTIGSKWQLIENLDIIAASDQRQRPQSRLMKSGDPLPPNAVLKRTHSDSGNHVILPKDNPVKRTWAYMDAHSNIPGCRWFSQAYIDLLRTVGEWRVVMVGGAPAYTIHTRPRKDKSWKYRTVTEFWPLDRLLYVEI